MIPPTFRWHAESISGSRKTENDDSYLIFTAGIEGPTELDAIGSDVLDKEDLIFAVSDGMGGGNAGYLASSLILEAFSVLIPSTFNSAAQGFHPDYLELLEQQVGAVHQSINSTAESSEEYKGMGATVSLCWFTPENVYIAHVGDSRIYLHRNGETSQVTDDHSFSWRKLKRGDVSERQYRNDPKRSILCECIGAGHRKVTPQITSFPYHSGDRVMICSDGIIDGCWEKHIHKALSQNMDSTSAAAEVLIARAIENAGSDDTTLIVLDIQ